MTGGFAGYPRRLRARLLALFAVTAAVAAGSIALAGPASAHCDNAYCVPNVARDVVNQSAQGSDGVPFICADMGGENRWAHRPDMGGENRWAHRPDVPG